MKQGLKTVLELFVLPGLAAILPWPWCFRLFKRAAAGRRFYPEVEGMVQGARQANLLVNEEAWRSALRMTRIFSFADLYLSMFRSDRWLEKYVDVTGAWPQGPFLAVTYHWGAGLWALRHLKANGKPTAFLSIRFDRSTFQNSPVRYWYALLRNRETARAGGGIEPIFTGGSTAKIAAAYKEGLCVAALLDVPPTADQASLPVVLFARPARLRTGLARLAIEQNMPIVTFAMHLDRDSGRLKLRIDAPLRAQTQEQAMQQMAASFGAAIDQDPCAWHGWAEVQCYFDPACA